MFFTNVKESGLESLLVNWLVNHNGYEQVPLLKKHSAGRDEKAPIGNQSTKNGAVSRPCPR